MFRIHPVAGAIACACAFVSSTKSFAAPETQLDAVVVTATRQPTRVSDLLSDVSVLEREQIQQAAQTTLSQLLAQQPGIQFQSNGGPGASTSLFIRGTEARHALVLIDGMRVSSATLGIAALENIPLSQVERIEILRGPASALYGSEAIGGVIQIFTRRGEGKPRFDAFAGYGGYRTSDINGGVSGTIDRLSFSLRAGQFDTRGFSATNDAAKQPFIFNADRDGFTNRNLSGSLAYRFGRGHELGLNAFHSDGRNQYDNGRGPFDSRLDKKLSSYSLYSRNAFTSNWTSTLRLGRATDELINFASATSRSDFRTDQDQLIWQNDIDLPVGRALLGYERTRQEISTTVSFPVRERTINTFLAGWTARIAEHRLQLNLRHDDNSQFGGKTTGFAGYGYQFTPALRANVSYATAFNAPTFNQLYFPNFGNPNLRPEEARNVEGGVYYEVPGARLSAVAFQNRVDDLIDTLCDPVTFICTAANVSKARIRGLSLGYQGEVAGWRPRASVDFLDPRNLTNDAQLSRRAKRTATLGLARQFGRVELGAEWLAVSRRFEYPFTGDPTVAGTPRELGGFALFNAIAVYRFAADWSLEARANNIGNRKYETATGFAMPGANLFVGVRYAPR
jgi:vitamin B12 transporter